MSQSFVADTDKLEAIASILNDQSQQVAAILVDVDHHLDALRSSAWEGDGAALFFAEMDEIVIPQLRMLHFFLTNTQRQIHHVIDEAMALEPRLDEIERQRPEVEALLEKLHARHHELQHAMVTLEARVQAMQAQALAMQESAKTQDDPQ